MYFREGNFTVVYLLLVMLRDKKSKHSSGGMLHSGRIEQESSLLSPPTLAESLSKKPVDKEKGRPLQFKLHCCKLCFELLYLVPSSSWAKETLP